MDRAKYENMTDPRVIAIKSALFAEIDEWLGFAIPVEGDDDYERWQNRLKEIEAIGSVQDARDYLEGEGREEEEIVMFFESCE